MKLNIIKSLALAAVVSLSFSSCDSGRDSNFIDSPDSGWVQFVEAESTPISLTGFDFNGTNNINIPVSLNAPLNSEDLNVNYVLEQVSGPNPNDFFNVSNVLTIAANTNGLGLVGGPTNLVLDLNDLAGLDEAMTFDVILQSTDRSSVQVGFADAPVSNRVTICPSLSSADAAFIGDYVLTVPAGAGPFGAQFEDGLVVTLSEGSSGELSRVFEADYLPAVGAGFPVVPVEFVFDLDNAEVLAVGTIGTGVGCGAEILLEPGDATDLPCGDATVEISLLDFAGGSGNCGESDVDLTILLTKV